MALVPIRTAAPAEHDAAVGTLVLAFSSDPLMRWFFPTAGEYLAGMPELTDAFARVAFDHESAYVTDGFEGASLWLPPGEGPDGAALEKVVTAQIRPGLWGEVKELFEQFEHLHIKERHWYLPIIGVEPAQHGQGLGAALLEHALAVCDRDGLPAYLESSNPRNLSLYQRHGFEAIGEIQAGSSPLVTPMLRRARTG